jgi:hypothetical protein
VLDGHVELRSDRRVAVVTQIDLSFGEEELRRWRAVDGMTTGTGNIRERVLGAANLRSGEIFGVASKAVVHSLNRLQQRKSDDSSLAASRFDMGFSGTVTSLAAGAFGRLPAAGNALVVRILIKELPDIRMTGFTYSASDVIGCLGVRGVGERPRLSPSA